MNDTLMSTSDVAAYLKMSSKWVMTEAKAGTIPATKVGKYWRFRRAEIDAWLASL